MRWMATPLSIVALSRAAAMVVVWMCVRPGVRPGNLFASWDGGWYTDLALHGYGPRPVGGPIFHSLQHLAFLPGAPYLARAVSEVTPLGVIEAGVVVSILCTCAAGVLLWRLLEPRFGADTASIALALLVFSPHAFVLSMFYTDAPMLLSVVLTFHWLHRRQWAAAGAAAFIGGLIRPNAFVLVIPCVIEAVQARRRGEAAGWRPFVAAVVAPLGFVAWLVYSARRTGSLLGYFDMQDAGWGSRIDGGGSTLEALGRLVTGSSLDATEAVSSIVFIVLGLGGLVLAWRARVPLSWFAYAAATVLLVFVNARQTSGPRFLITAFPLFVGWASVLPSRVRPALVGASAVVMAGLGFLAYTTNTYTP